MNQLVPMVEVTDEDESNILHDEVGEAMNEMKKCKAPGCDCIEAELWQALDESEIKVVWQLCDVI